MIVFRVLQIAISLFCIYFLIQSIYIFSGVGNAQEGDPYFSAKVYLTLFFAGIIMLLILYYITKFLKKHLS